EGSGTWYLNLRDGETRVADRPDSPPIVRLYQDRKDWELLLQAQLAGGAGLPALAPELTRSRIERLRTLDGSIAFRLGSDDGDRVVVVQFGSGERTEPRCIVSVRAEDALRLQARELTPQAAFMQGLVRLEGDLVFAMQVGTALFLYAPRKPGRRRSRWAASPSRAPALSRPGGKSASRSSRRSSRRSSPSRCTKAFMARTDKGAFPPTVRARSETTRCRSAVATSRFRRPSVRAA